jgi:hypothetical protein
MASTIKLKRGSGVPSGGSLAAGEPALDLTNNKLYSSTDGTDVVEIGFDGQFEDGSVSTPSVNFSSDTDTGIYRIGSGNFGFVSNGTKVAEIVSSGLQVGSKTRISYAAGSFQWGDTVAGTAATFSVNFTQVGSITATVSATAYNTSSDYRLKENVVPIENAVARIDNLNPVRFNFKVEPNVTVDGFLAHEVTPVVPEAITGEKDAVDADGNPVYQGIDQAKLVPLLVAAVQELSARVAAWRLTND